MKVYLYDHPVWHGLPVDRLEQLGLVRIDSHAHKTATPKMFDSADAVLIHVSDDPTQSVARLACKIGCDVILFTGDPTNAESDRRAASLRAQFAKAQVAMAPLWLLEQRLEEALRAGSMSILREDRAAGVCNLLSALWSVQLAWERDGAVYARPDGPQALTLVPIADVSESDRCLASASKTCDVDSLRQLRSPAGSVVNAVIRLIYKNLEDRPSVVFDTEFGGVRSPEAFRRALIAVRDSFLEWAQRASYAATAGR